MAFGISATGLFLGGTALLGGYLASEGLHLPHRSILTTPTIKTQVYNLVWMKIYAVCAEAGPQRVLTQAAGE